MTLRKTILVVDDNTINRVLLKKILSDRYDIVEAANGREGLDVLLAAQDRIAAVLLDIIMPVMGGYEFLVEVRQLPEFSALPIVVMTHSEDSQTEITALEKGATDFIAKPYQPGILKQRIHNILLLSEAAAFKNTAERDRLTGLYNKETFYMKAKECILASDSPCEIICIDIEHFKLINDLFGSVQGDKLLQFIAQQIKTVVGPQKGLCARLEADHFAICIPHCPETESKLIDIAETTIANYPLDMKISLRLGIYPVDDPLVPVNLMCDRANLAIESIKGKFHTPYIIYDDSHRQLLLEEQEIVNTMHSALKERQFEIYYQPKLDLVELRIIGAEALVRWNHPRMGMIPPGKFIPIFEKNGFISAMDEYIWEMVCLQIRTWIDQGKPVVPISVNVSRVDIFNPNLCTILVQLVDKYAIPAGMLRLEVTETAYRENPEQPIKTVKELRDSGFFVEMDDFGSGYSSLNVLKDIPVDTLKIDLRFLENNENTERGASILASVIRMAKWLNLPVTAEGVEKQEQIEFLRSIGCNNAQGYYFSRPVPVANFEALLQTYPVFTLPPSLPIARSRLDALWKTSSEFNLLFNSVIGAVGLYEMDGDSLELIRANEGYYALTGTNTRGPKETCSPLNRIVPEDQRLVLHCLHKAAASNKIETIQYRRIRSDGTLVWLNTNIRCLNSDTMRSLFYFSMTDITEFKRIENKLTQTTAKLDLLTNSLPCAVFNTTLEPTPKVLFANKACWDILGMSDPEAGTRILNQDLFHFIRTEDKASAHEALSTFYTNLKTTPFEYRITRPDGTVRWICGTINLLPASAGGPAVQILFWDATEQRRLEQMDSHHMDTIIKSFAVTICDFDIPNRTVHFSRSDRTKLSLPQSIGNIPESLLDTTYLPTESFDSVVAFHQRIIRGESPVEGVFKFFTPSGGFFWGKALYTTYFDDAGAPVRATGILLDVTAEVEAQQQYEKELQLRNALTAGTLGWLDVDIDTESLTGICPQFLASLGVSPGFPAGSLVHLLADSIVHPEDRALFIAAQTREALQDAFIQGQREIVIEYRRLVTEENTSDYLWTSSTLSLIRNPNDGHLNTFIMVRDIHQKKIKELNIKKKSQQDPLTGVLNRAALEEAVRSSLSSPHEGSAFMLFDLDNFKRANDQFGHMYGDDVLRAVAKTMRELFHSDIIGRLGGDEFIIFLSSIPSEQLATSKAEKLCRAINSLRVQNKDSELSCSIGIAISPRHGKSFEGLYQKTDMALYQAKLRGKNQYALYDPHNSFFNIDDLMSKEWLLDEMKDCIILSELKTHKLIHMNKAARKAFAQNSDATCHAVLHGLSAPCPFCEDSTLTHDALSSSIHTLAGQPPLMVKTKLVNWNGTTVRMEIATPLDDQTPSALAL